MNEFELRALYDRLTAERAAVPGRGTCVSPEALMSLAAGDATEDDRLTWLTHVASCADCPKELELARAVADAGNALVGAGVRRRMPYLALAASVVLIAGAAALWQSGFFEPRDVTRGVGGAGAVVLVAPAGNVSRDVAGRLVWRGVPGAVRYDVEVIEPSGALVYGAVVTDTATLVPQTSLKPGAEYRWRVTAELANGTRVSSSAQAFRVRAP